METCDATKKRWAARAFLPELVGKDQVRDILDTARWAPSGSNIQPWQVAVVTGKAKQKLGDALAAARAGGQPSQPEFEYYPKEWMEPYDSRRKACGLALYQALEISREEKEKRIAAWMANYYFFGAPVGLLFFMDRGMSAGGLIDMGIFIQSVMLAATDKGLATCPQAALAEYPDIVRAELNLPDSMLLVCGMSLGKADPDAPVNNYRTERAAVEEFTSFHE
ncbi:MAG: nitroreductase [Nitrospinota bacterium]|nr:nitroreductase [Nitrospinota bacterium]